LAQTTSANVSQYYHADGLGNVTALLNVNNQLSATYNYDPYGNLLSYSGPMADLNPYRFSSKEFYGPSGTYAYGYRHYDPNFQRWLNRDPIEEIGGINLYGFVFSNPSRFIDPFGSSGVDPNTYAGAVNSGVADNEGSGDEGGASQFNAASLKYAKDMIDGANGILDMTPTADFSKVAFGKDLDGNSVGGVERVVAFFSFLPADKILEAGLKGCKKLGSTLHHICTNKNKFSKAAGGPYTQKFEKLFKKAGIDLENGVNKVWVEGHHGPHPEYNRIVFERLQAAVKGLNGNAYREALENELKAIRSESVTPGSLLNNLITQ
jgi:RHS repeat-associated protein